jgi:hypothetical protein
MLGRLGNFAHEARLCVDDSRTVCGENDHVADDVGAICTL